MARKGLNCTLSYKVGSTTRTYRVRCDMIVHGTQMVAEESQARLRRAYYPHRVSTQQFGLKIILKGYAERRSFSNWLTAYATYALDPDLGGDYPTMSVSVPSYEFVHRGVPLTGYEYGDHVGSMIFNPTVMFEPAYEPWDKARPAVTRVEDAWRAFAKDDAIKYFYPFGTQLAGEDAPTGTYDKPIYPGDASGFTDQYGNDPDDIVPPSIVPPSQQNLPPGVLP
jgi:hypothetical protein